MHNYCQETVIVQAAFFLAEKTKNLEYNLKKDELAHVVKIIKNSIIEVSEGLSIYERPAVPLEYGALHRKLHLWFYKTWQRCCSSENQYLEGFPPLPKFGTELYISIVQEMRWESLFVECIINTDAEVIPFILQEVLSVLTHDKPCNKDIAVFTLLFDSFLTLGSKSSSDGYTPLIEVLLNGLSSLCEHIIDKRMQYHFLIKTIEFVFHRCFVHCFSIQHTATFQNIERNKNHLKTTNDHFSDPNPSTSNLSQNMEKPSSDNGLTETDPQVMFSLEILFKLFTKPWNETCHWSVKAKDNIIEQMDCVLWHPLHQWILKLYAALGSTIRRTKANTSLGAKVSSLHFGLTGYVETFATSSESQWIHDIQEGSIADWDGFNSLVDEKIELDSGQSTTFLFTHGSLMEQLDDAVWRINHNLEGSMDSLNWLLTTEELFDHPIWLECVKHNAVKMARKEQLVLIVDILCVQRQIIESVPEFDCSVFNVIKEITIRIFNDLPMLDQEEILRYIFSMSLVAGIDITCDSMFFHPSQHEEDKKKLQDELQVVFNKLVDGSLALRDIKQMALFSPYIVLFKALQTGVQYGQTHTILNILQELSILCKLCTSDTATPILCEIITVIATRLQNKQEEKNLLKLINMLIQQHRNTDVPAGMREPLLSFTNLVCSCILPYMNLQGNKNHISKQLALKFLKSSLTVFDVKSPTARPFVLRFLIPILLALCRLLDDCKIDWEEMVPNLPPADVAELRNLILTNIKALIDVIYRVFQGSLAGLIQPMEWLNNKLKPLDWTTALYVKPLLDHFPFKHQCRIPKCVIELCDLASEHWTTCVNKPGYDVIDGLFESCAVSDTISCQIFNALKEKTLPSMDDDHLKVNLIRNLGQVMTYLTWSEMSRILSLCKILIQKGVLSLKLFSHHYKNPLLTLVDFSSPNAIIVLSCTLHQVFEMLLSPNSLFSTSPIELSNVIKLYVSAINEMCQELASDPGLDKGLSGDIIGRVFDDLSHVMRMVPFEVMDPLFILALDVASMTYPPGDYKFYHHNETVMVNSSGKQEYFTQKHYYLVKSTQSTTNITRLTLILCRSFFGVHCSHVMLAVKDKEYIIFKNKSLLFKPTGQQYSEGEYDMRNTTPWICTKNYSLTFASNETEVLTFNKTLVKSKLLPVNDIHTDIRRYMTIVGFTISVLCLFLVLLTHGILRDLRQPLPGKNLISLSLALFLAHFWYLFGSGDTDKPLFCQITSYILHFLFLASFGCTFIVAYDTRRTFSVKTAKAHAIGTTHQAKRLVVYILLSWGVPLILVVTCAVLDLLGVVTIGYRNKEACWMGNETALLVVFAAPVGSVLVYNVLAFTQTIHSIRSARMQTQRVKSSHYSRPATLKIYIRLVSLMGFSWFFGISAPLIHQALMYPFVFFTTLQGLYIFLAFVCKARVLRMIKAKLPLTNRKPARRPTKGTTTTTDSRTSMPYRKYPPPKDDTQI